MEVYDEGGGVYGLLTLSALGRWAVELTGGDVSSLTGAETLSPLKKTKNKKQGREELQRTADTDCLKIRMRAIGSEYALTAFA